MLGDALWYPLWDKNNITSTATEIAKIIGDNGKISSNAKASSSSPAKTYVAPAPTTPTVVTSPQGKDHNAAHKVLLDAIKDGIEGIIKQVDELGISTADDLLLLEEADARLIAESLKKIPKRRFLTLLNYN